MAGGRGKGYRHNQPVDIRIAQPADFEAVGQMCFESYLAGGGLTEGRDDPYGEVLRDVAPRAASGLLLVVDGPDAGPIATATVAPAGTPFAQVARAGEFEVRHLAVAPQAWGHGVADRLMDWIEDYAREQGAEGIALSVLDGNRFSTGLYVRRGYSAAPDRDWCPDGITQLRVYCKGLG